MATQEELSSMDLLDFQPQQVEKLLQCDRRINSMDYKFQGIKTDIGYILSRRDAIYIDAMEQKNNSIIMKGEVNSAFCMEFIPSNKWYMFNVIFKNVKIYQCFNADIFYAKKLNNVEAFSEILNSDWFDIYNLSDKEYKHILIETYDFAYMLLCKDFDFSIIGKQ